MIDMIKMNGNRFHYRFDTEDSRLMVDYTLGVQLYTGWYPDKKKIIKSFKLKRGKCGHLCVDVEFGYLGFEFIEDNVYGCCVDIIYNGHYQDIDYINGAIKHVINKVGYITGMTIGESDLFSSHDCWLHILYIPYEIPEEEDFYYGA